MAVDILLGMQWGDEGKGKIVDFLAPKYDVVARFQGGPNAGHTLEFNGIKHVLHQIPSGIFHPEIKNIIGNGVVLDPIIFKKEIDKLHQFDINFSNNLFISKKAQLIIPTHRLLDYAVEAFKGQGKIGSTLKGISPTYQDKIGRQGLRVGDILQPNFKAQYTKLFDHHKAMMKFYKVDLDEAIGKIYDLQRENYTFVRLEKEFFEAVEFLKQFNLINSEYLLHEELLRGKEVLAEGAQGALLDIDFGSYPFVTSSNTTAAGVCSGLGVAPGKIRNVFGIFKAYCTRVGSGPFPTELHDEVGNTMREIGREYGSTTGRPRRCGWLDLPALQYSNMINGTTHLLMMKADVLNEFDQIKVCSEYKMPNGQASSRLPYDMVVEHVEPVYTAMEGWKSDLKNVSTFDELPPQAKAYIKYIENSTGVPISLVSVGPDRTQTLIGDALK